ncbi:MAG: cyclase family protein [Pyrinomonadaceae bacterium]|nr:cyclase family protein [Pyrinomonadaceae bacterium]
MKIYDVTFPISAETPIYEGDPEAEIKTVNSLENGDAANVSQICCGVHTATHVDAPNHFIEGTKRVHELDLNVLIGECSVIEINENISAIDTQHVETIENTERLLFKTRNSAFWNEPEKGFRTDFTYITPEAAQILVEKGVRLVGIDYLSVEKFGSDDFLTHLTLLKNEVIILEGLDLREVSGGTYELICLPLKYIGGKGEGAPARTILRKKSEVRA